MTYALDFIEYLSV